MVMKLIITTWVNKRFLTYDYSYYIEYIYEEFSYDYRGKLVEISQYELSKEEIYATL